MGRRSGSKGTSTSLKAVALVLLLARKSKILKLEPQESKYPNMKYVPGEESSGAQPGQHTGPGRLHDFQSKGLPDSRSPGNDQD